MSLNAEMKMTQKSIIILYVLYGINDLTKFKKFKQLEWDRKS